MLVSAIVAVAKNRVIGKDNDIPWYLSSDLKYFKKTTLNHHVIMGRKSFQSIGRPLPKRTNIILTRDPFFIATGCITAHTLEEALNIAHENGEEEAFIIGGAQIYNIALPYLDKLYYTAVDAEPAGDILFPEINWGDWRLLSQKDHPAGERDDYPFSFKVYERKKEA
ncbi:MAG TPA: dihydrofolate reductase [Saprospiraceae bacterium]|nr:dihydrofolate reductase [Saprospiraceae bacterium]